MAKRLAGTRALVHVLKPNKSKPPGPVKRARKSIRKAKATTSRFRKAKVKRTVIGIGKTELRLAKGAGRGVVGAAQKLPPRTRRKTIVLRSAGGRFAGSRSQS